MTKQTIFNKVYKHLLTQKKKSQTKDEYGNFNCLYRGPNEMKCAIGVLIPNKHYQANFEGCNIAGLIKKSEWAKENFSDNEDFLDNLQNIHDNFRVSQWKKELKALAKVHNLRVVDI